MKGRKWGVANGSQYLLDIDQQTRQFGRIQHNVKGFIKSESGSNRDLYMFKNILSAKLQNNIQQISGLTTQQIAVKYLPFVFNIMALPDEVILALAASKMRLAKDSFKSLAEMGAKTIQYEAKKCIQESVMYGGAGIQVAIELLSNQKSGFKTAVSSLVTAYQKAQQTLSNLSKGVKSFFQSSKSKAISKVQDAEYHELIPTVAVGGAELLSAYIKNIRAYGSVLIDFWYLTNYAIKTTAYGKSVMFIPTLVSLLFSLDGGVVKVFLKSQNSISLIQEKQFTPEFLQGLAKAMAARDNADIIKQYNYQVSTNSLKENQRQKFKDNLNQNVFSMRHIAKKVQEVQKGQTQ